MQILKVENVLWHGAWLADKLACSFPVIKDRTYFNERAQSRQSQKVAIARKYSYRERERERKMEKSSTWSRAFARNP